MIYGGDEVLKTSFGNNNTYAQDNIYSWINWPDITDVGKRMQSLIRKLMEIRKKYISPNNNQFHNRDNLIWYRPDGQPMQSDDWHGYVRAVSYLGKSPDYNLFMIFNAFDQDLKWQLPTGQWALVLDTTNTLKNAGHSIKVPAWSILLFKQEVNNG